VQILVFWAPLELPKRASPVGPITRPARSAQRPAPAHPPGCRPGASPDPVPNNQKKRLALGGPAGQSRGPPSKTCVRSACTVINHMPLAPVYVGVCLSFDEVELSAEKRERAAKLRCASPAARTAARIASITHRQPAFDRRPPQICPPPVWRSVYERAGGYVGAGRHASCTSCLLYGRLPFAADLGRWSGVYIERVCVYAGCRSPLLTWVGGAG
jgi:hypothetical protein